MCINKKYNLVSDILISPNSFPVVTNDEFLKVTIDLMNKFKLGIACIVDENFILKAVITDGDLRRLLINYQKPKSAMFVEEAINYAKKEFIYIFEDKPLIEAIKLMGKYKILDLPVVDKNKKLLGLVHLQTATNFLLINN